MAEEKAFEATPARLERAKREGDSPRSQELGNVAAFAAGLAAAAAVAAPLGSAARTMLGAAQSGGVDGRAFALCFTLMLVPVGCAALAAAACSALQGGGLRVVSIAFKAERLAPAENLKRIFSREAVVTAVRATVAFACAGAALVPAFAAIYGAAVHAASIGGMAQAAWNGALHAAALACAVGAAFAAADYAVQVRRWRLRLRMSLEELKRDQKEHDGDPLARGRRRAMHRQISRGSLRRVKDAAFVVTNPTHIAIAIEYRPPEVSVPRILVRAADEGAARVRELAAAYRVPLVENVPLARALYATAQPGQYAPQETYIALAEIVAALGKGGRS